MVLHGIELEPFFKLIPVNRENEVRTLTLVSDFPLVNGFTSGFFHNPLIRLVIFAFTGIILDLLLGRAPGDIFFSLAPVDPVGLTVVLFAGNAGTLGDLILPSVRCFCNCDICGVLLNCGALIFDAIIFFGDPIFVGSLDDFDGVVGSETTIGTSMFDGPSSLTNVPCRSKTGGFFTAPVVSVFFDKNFFKPIFFVGRKKKFIRSWKCYSKFIVYSEFK